MSGFWQRWNFGLMLLAAYLGTFHLWLQLDAGKIAASGVLVSVVLSGLLLQAALRGYFVNRLDLGIHAVVILDILLEATVIPVHEGLEFYACAAGFALIIGLYRARCLKTSAPVARV